MSIITKTSEENGLIDMLRHFCGDKEFIDESTRIYQDLHLAGDDIDELLQKIKERWGTLFTGLDLDAYFSSEIDAFFYFLLSKVGIRDKRSALTVGHMAKVIKRGLWFEPPPPDP